jgi:hypothetical protein
VNEFEVAFEVNELETETTDVRRGMAVFSIVEADGD